jgi:hypothetical protein
MINKSTIKRFAYLWAFAAAMMLTSGTFSQVHAQRDPFAKPGFMKSKGAAAPTGKSNGAAPGALTNYGPPAIEARIEYYKRLREAAVANGSPLPKVTSVLTLNEMAVTGIFKTPRGYSAMVEATPIKLSYTIYPGEKFFDGQLVAVEENKLVFRKVTKVGAGKFVASVENKPLKEYTQRAQIEGTAPTEPSAKQVEVAQNPAESNPTAAKSKAKDKGKAQDTKSNPNAFVSPLDEMNSQPANEKAKKGVKKPVKVAKNNDQ